MFIPSSPLRNIVGYNQYSGTGMELVASATQLLVTSSCRYLSKFTPSGPFLINDGYK